MGEHICNKEEEIALMWNAINKLDIAINGNGSPGMKANLACIKNDISHIVDKQKEASEEIRGLSQGIRAMITFVDETKSANQAVTEYKLSARQKTKIWITGIVGFATTIIGILKFVIK